MSLKRNKAQLKLDWCSHEAAKYAVEHWHYSKCMPAGKTVKIGVWEDTLFIGCVIFGRGANNNIGAPYHLKQTEVCELIRVALKKHVFPVSRIVAIAIKLLKKQSPGIRLIVSYADPAHGHIGSIYQAMNWLFCGVTEIGGLEYCINGKWVHPRSLACRHGTNSQDMLSRIYPNAMKRHQSQKYKYLLPLDEEMKQQIATFSKSYPKKSCATCATSIEGDALSIPTERGSFDTIVALQVPLLVDRVDKGGV